MGRIVDKLIQEPGAQSLLLCAEMCAVEYLVVVSILEEFLACWR